MVESQLDISAIYFVLACLYGWLLPRRPRLLYLPLNLILTLGTAVIIGITLTFPGGWLSLVGGGLLIWRTYRKSELNRPRLLRVWLVSVGLMLLFSLIQMIFFSCQEGCHLNFSGSSSLEINSNTLALYLVGVLLGRHLKAPTKKAVS